MDDFTTNTRRGSMIIILIQSIVLITLIVFTFSLWGAIKKQEMRLNLQSDFLVATAKNVVEINKSQAADEAFALATAKKVQELNASVDQVYASFFRAQGRDSEVIQ